MRPSLLVLALAACCANPLRAEEWVIQAHYPDRAALIRAASRFQHVDVDAQRQVLRVDTDEAGIRALEDAGLSVSIDAGETARLRGAYAKMREAIQSRAPQLTGDGYPSIPGYACYRTVEGTYQTMDDLAAAQPGLAEVHEIGPTWQKTQNTAQGYTMRALRVTNLATAAADPQRPKMVVFGSIHAREYTPAELLTRMAEWLVTGYGSDAQATWLVDHVDFRFVLQANPDGRKKAETGIWWRKNTDTVSGNCSFDAESSGIDLNRNFPFHWHTTGETGSSSDRCDETYRGPTAGSEPETQNLVSYVAGAPGSGGVYSGGVLPDRRADGVDAAAPDDYAGLFFDIHSYSRLVLWSWGDTESPAPNDTALRSLGRRMAWFNGYTPQAAIELYPTDGATDDTFYGLLGVPSYTIELGNAFFESCSSFTGATYPKNFAALKYAARTAHAPYRLGAGPDVYDLAVSAVAQGAGGSYVTLTATIDDLRYNQSNGSQTTYAIQAANAYLDTPPWQPGATPIALAATDGGFNGKTEAVHGDVALSGLAPGRHILYVQGVNALGGGTPGAPDAVFVDVPAPSGDVTATPVAVGEGAIDPSTPQTVPSGTSLGFTLTPAPGHHVATAEGCPGTFATPTYTTAPLLADCTLTATFEPDPHTVGGTLADLTGDGLALRLNGGAELAIHPPATTFLFPDPLPYGAAYEVTIATQPAGQTCTIADAAGTVAADVDDVAVSCADASSDVIFDDGFDP
ncbi:M14 family zinc carboxypeptidase [Dokdonella ginsengisoli]|uniref:M14 family zinc carboxypeptidase n=1 Tax=Dokdonella ginsengisoli TaxID=363846 RepID=A0ABV9QU01_9GAMM